MAHKMLRSLTLAASNLGMLILGTTLFLYRKRAHREIYLYSEVCKIHGARKSLTTKKLMVVVTSKKNLLKTMNYYTIS